MPRRSRQSTLDNEITTLATQFGQAVAKAVRASIHVEVAKLMRARSNGAAPPRRGRSRAAAEAVQQKIADVLDRSKSGMQVGEIVRKTGILRGAVAYHLKVMRRKKKVRVIGTRGQARWVP